MTRRLPLAVLTAALASAVVLTPPAGVTAVEIQQDDDGIDDFVLSPEIVSVTDIALDAHGNIVVAGRTFSPDFPVTPDAADPTCGREGDAFVQVFEPGGTLRYSTCLGSEDDMETWPRVAPAPDGSLWVAAHTFPLRQGWPGTMLWRVVPGVRRYMDIVRVGGRDAWTGEGHVAAAPDGSVWITGATSGHLQTVNAWQPTLAGELDFYVGHYAPGRMEPLVLTYLGGAGTQVPADLALAPDGDAVVIGMSASTGEFPLARSFQASSGGHWDLVLARLDATGKWLEYSSYLGGSGDECYASLAVDRLGNAHVAGRTLSGDFPTTDGSTARDPERDVFVAGIDPAGRLLYSTIAKSSLDAAIPLDASLHVSHAGVSPVGWALVVGGYSSYASIDYPAARAGWFFAVIDPFGFTFRPAALMGYAPGRALWIEAVASRLSDIYLAYLDPSSSDRSHVVITLRVDATGHDADRPPAGGHDRR
jgi:hypothetical protein